MRISGFISLTCHRGYVGIFPDDVDGFQAGYGRESLIVIAEQILEHIEDKTVIIDK